MTPHSVLDVPISEAEYLRNIGDLWGRGWSVIPLELGGKRPVLSSWLDYQTRPATFAELEAWFGTAQRSTSVW